MSWFNPNLLKSTVLIARMESYEKEATWGDIKENYLGTGFLVKYRGMSILVTARHVITKCKEGADPRVSRTNLLAFIETKTGIPQGIMIDENQKRLNCHWLFSEFIDKDGSRCDIDLAVTPIGLDLQITDARWIPENLIGDWNDIQVGENIFFLGFPLGITPGFHVLPSLRSGVVSLKIEQTKEFLLDAVSISGSSGSPIFSINLMLNTATRKIAPFSRLLGIITGHVEVIGHNRTENAYLARVLAVTHVKALIKKAYQKFKHSLK